MKEIVKKDGAFLIDRSIYKIYDNYKHMKCICSSTILTGRKNSKQQS